MCSIMRVYCTGHNEDIYMLKWLYIAIKANKKGSKAVI